MCSSTELRGAVGELTVRDRVLNQLQRSRAQFTNEAAWFGRRKELREEFLKGAGLWPLPEKKPLEPIIHSRREYDGYSVENVALETMPGFFCTGNLYRPLKQDKPGPGILCPHGHFKPLGRMRPEHQIRCAQFARMGATVFSYSMVGWQDSQQTTHDDPVVLALQTWNSIRALDYLCSLPEVDTNRLAITGASGGGTQTFFLAALDDRVRVSAPVVIVYPWTAPAGCKCEGGLPVMQTAQTDAIELAASVAPRAQLLISCGGDDETRDFPQVGFPFVQRVYSLHGKSNLVENVHLADEGHDFGPSKRKAVYAFFSTHLGLPSADEDLSKITIEPPEKLAVFNDQHPLPTYALKGSEQVGKVFHASARPPTTPEGESFFFIAPGFAHEGQVVRSEEKGNSRLKITVRDGVTSRPTPCRINVVGPDGNFYQPPTNHLTPHALTSQWPKPGTWGNRREKSPYRYLGRFFYATGEVEVAVPPGQSRVEVWKGFEFSPRTQTVDLAAGQSRNIDFTITRSADVSALGYFGGDPHLHIPRRNQQDENTIFDLMSAEDIQFAALLAYNEPAGPYAGFMDKMDSPQPGGLGVKSVREHDGYSIIAGQEYRSTTYGHLLLYLRDELVFPGKSFNADNWPVYGKVGRETRDLGGLAIMAHGGYAQEIYADVALGTIDAVELLQFSIYRGIGLEGWYHILNSGYRFPIVGASDWPACRFLGDSRTFVRSEGRPSFPDWLRGAAEGRSFVTSGPMLLLEIDGQKPGVRLNKTGPGPHTVTARLRVRCEVTPVAHVELIVNGVAMRKQNIPEHQRQSAWWEGEQQIELRESSWIAARAYSTTPGGQPDAEAHTNPIYVYLDGRAPYSQASLDAWLAKIDGQITTHRKRDFAEKARVLDYFQEARDTLLKIRERSGLRSDEKAPVSQEASTSRTSLDADAGSREPTEEELKAFLRPIPPKPPAEALKTFEVADGFRMELVAAEPLVYNPVAAAFDEDANLYVCEMRDYPYKPTAGREPIGSVRLLRDTDGDGVFDKSTVFADKLLWAAGVAPWKGGVFVAAPPDIWYFKDTDGDDRADERRKVFTGFGTDNQQAMLNNLVWWLDHKIYGVTAGNGGAVRPAEDPPAKPVEVNGRDFRFDPVSNQFETLTGTVQFGNTFDDWGNRFVCSESQPLQHVVLPQQYLARNPYLPVPAGIHNIAPGPVPIFRISPLERWRQIRSNRRIANQERSAESPDTSHHVIDAAAGVTVYRGGAYPTQYYGTVFIGDGQNNLVHHRILTPDGVTFQSRRAEEQMEFLRSSDLWFRPVNFVNAPDGTLYCLDMSREVLESIHIPLDVVKHLDLASGRDHGRIYRIAPPGFRSAPPPRLGRAKSDELVAALESPHGWSRDTAHRLIYERQDKSLVPLLESLVARSKLPQARLHALWSLHGLNSLSEKALLTGLGDSHPGVRENAVRLTETRLNLSPELLNNVLLLAGDLEARVRFQVAFTLGEVRDTGAVKALVGLATRHGDDQWMRTAVLSSVTDTPHEMLALLLADPAVTTNAVCFTLCEQVAEMAGHRHRHEELRKVLSTIATARALNEAERRDRLLLAVGRGLKRTGERLTPQAQFRTAAVQLLEKSSDSARQAALNQQLPEARRVTAIELLVCSSLEQVRETLLQLLDASQPISVQIAAVRALADYSDSAVADLLLQRWRQYTPEVRSEALRALLSREERTLALLRAAERGDVSLADTDLTRREMLLRHANEEVRALARKVFGDAAQGERAKIVADYRGALRLDADPKRGAPIFDRNCSICHALNGKGAAVGPDLASSSSRDAESLLVDIVNPGQYLPPKFIQYSVEDKQGRTFTGIIASQTANSITLKEAQDTSNTILRTDIKEMRSSGVSLMPEGFESAINHQEMADLIAFLRTAKPAAGKPVNPHRDRDFGTLPGLLEPPKGP